MKLFEYLAKDTFSKYNLPVPKGQVVDNAEDLTFSTYPAAVKAQILIGSRLKEGCIKFASDFASAKKHVKSLLSKTVKNLRINKVLVEEKIDIAREFYLACAVDRSLRLPVLIGSAEGGIDIEDVPAHLIYKKAINPFVGIQPYMLRELLQKIKIEREFTDEFVNIVKSLYKLFISEDAELAEINPLVLTADGRFICCDAKLIIDDDALYRHPEYLKFVYGDELSDIERRAKESDIALVKLDGNIGVIANGAGLTMATLDSLALYGGKGGIFLDLGGTDDVEKVKKAFILLKQAKPDVIFLNIFGGITKCDTVAKGIVEALKTERIEIPLVARIKGLNEDAARFILKSAGIMAVEKFEDAARTAVEIAKNGNPRQ
jgi:succinyl-CoA synthetase beta subunit